ncbi:MAG: BamA/TamA family outer membrane protein [Chitinophagales bacterium]
MKRFKAFPHTAFFAAWCLVLSVLLFSSCSNTRHLAEGEELYTKGKIEMDPASVELAKNEVVSSLESVMIPKPNKKFLGARMKLAIYNRVKEPKKETGFKHFLKYKIGEPPVLMSSVDTRRTESLMENRLNTFGHFRSNVTDTVVRKNQKVTVTYFVNIAASYVIDSVFFPKVTDRLTKKIDLTRDSSFLRPGDTYNLQVISIERERIDRMLKIEGYYFFNADFIIVRVDTTIGDHHCKMYVDLKRNIPSAALRYYSIGDIYVFPEYSLNQKRSEVRRIDTILVDSIYYVSARHLFRPAAILQNVYFHKGEIYDARDYNRTIGRLMGLGVFKYGNIKLEPDSLHDGWLTTKIFLTPLPKRSIRGEVEGIIKDNGFAGPGLTIGTRNRNIFRGAELFVVNFTGNYELQVSRNVPPLQTFKVGITPQLIFPKFLVPFKIKRTRSVFVPKTKIEANYTVENREGYYLLNSFYVNFGYDWKETITKEHSLTPITVNYVNTTQTTEKYDSIIGQNPALQESFERQFVIGINYAYTFTDQVYAWRKNPVYFKGTVEFSGNSAYAIQSLFHTEKGTPENPFEIFQNAYSQYGWLSLDFRYYLATGKYSKLASRIFTGMAFPYGNSDLIPYYKSFSAGGVSDLRGFRSRSVGPGTFYDPVIDSIGYYNQVGDIKLGLAMEYRFPIAGYLKGALFAEGGNVWMQSTKLYGEEGVFKFDEFYRELAIDAGIGLRLDITYVVVRFDLATPLRKPYITENDGWKFDPFSKNQYGRSNLIFNFGIGYPF